MRKRVLLGSVALVLGLAACGPDKDGTTAAEDSAPSYQDVPQQTTQVPPSRQIRPVRAIPAPDITNLARQYAGKTPAVIGVMETQLDGANALLVTFNNVPLAPQQNFDSFLQLTDKASGVVDGHWELADNLMELQLRHLEPERELELLVSLGLKAVNDLALAEPYQKRLKTSAVQSVISFASRGSLLPDMADGLAAVWKILLPLTACLPVRVSLRICVFSRSPRRWAGKPAPVIATVMRWRWASGRVIWSASGWDGPTAPR